MGIDLRQERLNVSMPAGMSTAVVLLDVEKDLWVPRNFPAQGPEQAGLPDPTLWTVCVLVRPIGLEPAGELAVAVFELQGGALASRTPLPIRLTDHGPGLGFAGHMCVTNTWAENPRAGISEEVPRDIRLVVVFAAFEEALANPDDADLPIPAFDVIIGIGTTPCTVPNEVPELPPWHTYCGPAGTRPAEPLARAGRPTFSLCFTLIGCDEHGDFEIVRQEDANGGILALDAVRNTTAPAVLFMHSGFQAGNYVAMPNTIEVTGQFADGTLEAGCKSVHTFYLFVQGETKSPGSVTSHWEANAGGGAFVVSAYELPLDLGSLGWRLPAVYAVLNSAAFYTKSIERFGDEPCLP